MRVAALYDAHGKLPALEAVLSEVAGLHDPPAAEAMIRAFEAAAQG